MIKINDFKIENTFLMKDWHLISYKDQGFCLMKGKDLAISFVNVLVDAQGFYEYCELFESSEDNQ